MLGTLYKHSRQTTFDELSLIVSGYFHDRELVGKRLHEQIATGTVIISGDTIYLTEKGVAVVRLNIIIGRIFNLDMNNIKPNI
jgi:hypothetical protein